MRRILLMGMSGVGKSTIVGALRQQGFRAVDTDIDACQISSDGEYLWDEAEIQRLLEHDESPSLFVVGTASNQVRFYPRFDCIALLTAPAEVMVQRITARTNNPFGKSDDELAMILRDKETVEPMLRRAADLVIDADRPLDSVVGDVIALVES